MAKVEIFYSQMCDLCHKAMDYFDEQGIPFDAYEVRWKGNILEDSPAARDLLSRIQQVEFVPQIFVNDKHISGWKSLSELIATGEIGPLLKSGPEQSSSS